MESGHADEAASMAATAAAGGDLLDHSFCLSNGLTVEEHNELVKSALPHRASVGRIILQNEMTKGTGTAFLVYRGDGRSLFLTCNHNFGKKLSGEVIRLLPTATGDKVKDYPIEHIIYRHESRDILFFTVKDLLPGRQCLELMSTDEVKQNDRIVLLGFSGGRLPIDNTEPAVEPALVVSHSILPGLVFRKTKSQDDQYHEEIYYSCAQAIHGHSGSPVFKSGKVVAVHISSDKTDRDGVPTNTIMHSLREHLGLGTDNEATIDKLLEDLYITSAHVPYAKRQPVKKNLASPACEPNM